MIATTLFLLYSTRERRIQGKKGGGGGRGCVQGKSPSTPAGIPSQGISVIMGANCSGLTQTPKKKKKKKKKIQNQ